MDNNSHPLPHRTMQHRRGELTGRDLRLAQFAFERGAAGEEFVHFGDNAFLFGEGWDTDHQIIQNAMIEIAHGCTDGATSKIGSGFWGTNHFDQKWAKDFRRSFQRKTA